MAGKILLTEWENGVLSAFWDSDKGHMVQMDYEANDNKETTSVGDIYIGRVRDVVPNLEAAFIEFDKGKKGYYSFRDNPPCIFLNKKQTQKICEGDAILVQVQKEAVKTKDLVLTSAVSFTGNSCVLVAGKNIYSISKKIKDSRWRQELKQKLEQAFPLSEKDYGFIVRTAAYSCSEEEILAECRKLAVQWEDLKEVAKYRTCYTKLYNSPRDYLRMLLGSVQREAEEIVTDSSMLFHQLQEFLQVNNPSLLGKLRFYQDDLLPLYKLYHVEKAVSEALSKKVWLKSGGYLIIESTEACHVIDVNTGKYESKKRTEESFLKLNKEAAIEIARQLRLRNLSGIVIVDFINMEQPESKWELIACLKQVLEKDPVGCYFVDFTKLGLAELTRRKERKPFREQMESVKN